MSGIIHSLLVLAGLRAPRRAPSARLRGKGTPPGQAVAGRARPSPGRKAAGKQAPGKQAPQRGVPANGTPRPAAGKAQAARPHQKGNAQRTGGGSRPLGRTPPAPERMPASVHEVLDDVFRDLSPMRPQRPPSASAPPRPRQRSAQTDRRPPPRHRSVSGLGMFALATLCLSLGGWAGSQVQAYAYGVAPEIVNPAEMRSIDPPNDFKF